MARFPNDTILSFLETGKSISCGVSGYSVVPVKNFDKFVHYAKNYPIDSLILLTNAKYDLTLRVYSIWALLLREYDSVDVVAKDLLSNRETIFYYCGCIAGQDFPTNQFIYLLFSGKIDTGIKKLDKKKLRSIESKYNPGTSKVMQPCYTNITETRTF